MKTLLLSLILAIAILKCVSAAKKCHNYSDCARNHETKKIVNGIINFYNCRYPSGSFGGIKATYGYCEWVSTGRKQVATLNELDRENYDNDSFSGSAVLICLLSGFTAGAYGAWYFSENKEYSKF